VQEEDKSVPLRDSNGMCVIAKPNEVGLIMNVVNNTVMRSRFDGYSDAAATNKKLVPDVVKKGDCYFNSGDLLYRSADGFYYWSDRVGDTFRYALYSCQVCCLLLAVCVVFPRFLSLSMLLCSMFGCFSVLFCTRIFALVIHVF
jgi:acyl-CoA synthetase (AMP-forming)/AMP-acid ligase II